MSNSLFSTYSQQENQVTQTLISVLNRINSELTEHLLESLIDESDFELVSYENQSIEDKSTPDARIGSSVEVWFETKIHRDSIREKQIRNHLEGLNKNSSENQRLIALTPDEKEPKVIEDIEDDRLVWCNFSQVVSIIGSILERDASNTELSEHIPTDIELNLLREFQRFLYEEDLVEGKEERVLVVAARKAWPEFQETGLYFCQPNRSFKPSSHIAFYTDGEVKTKVPRAKEEVESIELSKGAVEENEIISDKFRTSLLEALDRMEDSENKGYGRLGKNQKVMLLEDDIELESPIINNKTAKTSDQKVAFVQGHRYVSLEDIKQNPGHTTELE